MTVKINEYIRVPTIEYDKQGKAYEKLRPIRDSKERLYAKKSNRMQRYVEIKGDRK